MKKALFALILVLLISGCMQKDMAAEDSVQDKGLQTITGDAVIDVETEAVEEVPDEFPAMDEGIAAEKGIEEGTAIPGEEDADVSEPEEAEEEKTESEEYSLDELREYLIESTGRGYHFDRDENYPEYYNSNDMKFYVINVLEDKVYDSRTFYERFSAENWDGYLHFLNRTHMRQLRKPLTEENYTDESKYREYVQQRALVEQTFIENTIELDEGKVLEYQGINWMFSPNDYFRGAYADTLLIYKIYCSPELVVFIRPSWKEFKLYLPASKKSDAYANWAESVNKVRGEMLDISGEILSRCPVDKDFFEDLPDEEFRSTKTLAYYWKTEYQFYWNLTMNLTAQVEPMEGANYAGKYTLKRVNFSFTNHEPDVLWGSLLLNIRTIPDGKDDDEYEFKDEKDLGIKIKSGETIKRDLEADHPDEKKPRFSDNLTINYELYKYAFGFAIRSKSITIDTNGTVIKEG